MADRAILWIGVSSQPQAAAEKESLPDQERRLRALADERGWQVIDVIIVPGFSRRYYNFPEFARAAETDGIAAPTRMLDHWERHDFDWFICYDGSRFGRGQAIFAEVVERTIDAKARIFTVQDGIIDHTNYRMYAAMGGYAAAGELDKLRDRRLMGLRRNAQEGKAVAPRVFWVHKSRRDDRGKRLPLELDESKRRLFDDLAELILDGVAWQRMEVELAKRGHLHPKTGKPYNAYWMHKCVFQPAWWGHTAQNLNGGSRNGEKRDLWVLDEAHEAIAPLPEGVTMFRNVVPAVWTGELAERIKAELRRRRDVARGSGKSQRSNQFSGLLVCDECGYLMPYSSRWKGRSGEVQQYIGCVSRALWNYNRRPQPCSQNKSINEKRVVAWLDKFLRLMLDAGTPDALNDRPPDDIDARQAAAQADLNRVQEQIARLIAKQATAPDALRDAYDVPLAALGEQLTAIRARLAALRRVVPSTSMQRAQGEAFGALKSMTMDDFWALSPGDRNRILHRLFGHMRIAVRGAQIVGVKRIKPRQGRIQKR